MKRYAVTNRGRFRGSRRARRGGALLVAIITIVVLAGLASAVLNVTMSAQMESRASHDGLRALYNCEAGVSHALGNIATGAAGPIGSLDQPLGFGGGGYSVTIQVDPDDEDLYSILAVGGFGGEQRALEVVARSAQEGPFANAIFAGNEDGDPNYVLEFGGEGSEADDISGGVYSGGDIDIRGDAEIDGPIVAAGDIQGGSGDEGKKQAIPDIVGMDYENHSDVFVLQEFYEHSSWESDAFGGKAYQVPEDNPAHIFRVNPTDRSAETSSTEKHDFFLEDPYENVRVDPNQNGKDASWITLTGGNQAGPDGNEIVYFIDGNLWLHNNQTYSFKIAQKGGGSGTHVTFVVKGNIYFSDNLYLQNQAQDAIAFIAIEDEQVADSGNIYFGDPAFGTLRTMEAFLYAQNNFYDNNLDAWGSAKVTLRGIMSAGNQVLIQRDYEDHHSKLTVDFDSRVYDGSVVLPGLPDHSGAQQGVQILSWREVPVPRP